MEKKQDKSMFLYAFIMYVIFNVAWIYLMHNIDFHAYGGRSALIREVKKGWIYPIIMAYIPKMVYTISFQRLKIEKQKKLEKMCFFIENMGIFLFYYFLLKICCEQQILRFIFYYGLLGAWPNDSYAETPCTYYIVFQLIVLLYVIPVVSAIDAHKELKGEKEQQIQMEQANKRHIIIAIDYTLALAIFLLLSMKMIGNARKSAVYNYLAEGMDIFLSPIIHGLGLCLVILAIIKVMLDNPKKGIMFRKPILMLFTYIWICLIHNRLAYQIYDCASKYFRFDYAEIFALCVSGSSMMLGITLAICSIKRKQMNSNQQSSV